MNTKKELIVFALLIVVSFYAFSYDPSGQQEYVFPYNQTGSAFPYTVYKTEKDANFETNAIHLSEEEYQWYQFYLIDTGKQSIYGKEIYQMFIENDEVYFIPELPIYIISARTLEEGLKYADVVGNQMHVFPGSELYVVDGQFGNRTIYYLLNDGTIVSDYEFEGIRDILNSWRVYQNRDELVQLFFSGFFIANKEDDGQIMLLVNTDYYDSLPPFYLMFFLHPSRQIEILGACTLYSEGEKIGLYDVVLSCESGKYSLSKVGETSSNSYTLFNTNTITESLTFDASKDEVLLDFIFDYLASEKPTLEFKGRIKNKTFEGNKDYLAMHLNLLVFISKLIQSVK